MPVNPIDLQTLYVQMSQHGKDQANTRAAVAHNQELQAQKIAKEMEAKGHSVNKMEAEDDSSLAVRTDDRKEGGPAHQPPGKKKDQDQPGLEKKKEEFQDPNLGKHIDITG